MNNSATGEGRKAKGDFSVLFAWTLGLIFLSPLAPLSSLHAASLNDEAQIAWANRADQGQTQKAIDLWEKSLQQNPKQPELWIRLTEAMGRAVRRASNKSEAKSWADRAVQAGKTAVAENPRSAPAHAFYAEAVGQRANLHKGLSSLGNVKKAVSLLKEAITIDPSYGYAHMLISEFYRQAPSSISIGDKKKALEFSKKAVALEPDRAINHLSYAKALIANDHADQAIEQLTFVTHMTPRPDLIPETQSNQEDARKLLACMNGQASKGKSCAK